jgi:hypothetical protein
MLDIIILIGVGAAVIGYTVYNKSTKNKNTATQPVDNFNGTTAPMVNTIEGKAEEIAPVAQSTACGCGRSPTGECVGLHLLSEEEWKAQQHPVETATDDAKNLKSKPAKTTKVKKTATDSTEPKIKKPRTPRKPKVQ